jgi:hypothetical protein
MPSPLSKTDKKSKVAYLLLLYRQYHTEKSYNSRRYNDFRYYLARRRGAKNQTTVVFADSNF